MFNLGLIIVHWLNYCMCQCMCRSVCAGLSALSVSSFLPPWHASVSLANLLTGDIARPW